MTAPASLSKWAHPPRSKTPRSSSSGPPGPCITPSTETCVVVASFMIAFPFWISSSGRADTVLGQDGIDLADRLRQALLHAHRQDLGHRLGAREAALDGHPAAAGLDRLDRHESLRALEVEVWRAVVVGEPVEEDEPVRWFGLEDVPEAVRLVAAGGSHVGL